MRIIKNSGNYLRHHSQAYLIIFAISSGSFLALFLTSIHGIPFYHDFGTYEINRGQIQILLLIMMLLTRKKYSAYKTGLDGEKQVIDYLSANLSDDYYLINDIIRPSKRDRVNIDHILVWKDGVAVIETKNNRGDVTFYGDNWNITSYSPIYQVRSNAAYIYYMIRSAGILLLGPPIVTGLVVFPQAQLVFNSETSTPVKNLDEVSQFIKTLKGEKEYSVEKMEEIAKAIIDSSQKAQAEEGELLGVLWKDFRDLFV